MLCNTDEIVEDVLFVLQHPSSVPFLPEFASTPEVGQGDDGTADPVAGGITTGAAELDGDDRAGHQAQIQHATPLGGTQVRGDGDHPRLLAQLEIR